MKTEAIPSQTDLFRPLETQKLQVLVGTNYSIQVGIFLDVTQSKNLLVSRLLVRSPGIAYSLECLAELGAKKKSLYCLMGGASMPSKMQP